jgi:exonuclease SbcC
VHEITILILDEIFGSRDEERRNNLLTALRMRESCFLQILLISHIAEIQGGFANTLMVETGADNASKIRVAE